MKISIRFSLIAVLIGSFTMMGAVRTFACSCAGGQPLLNDLAYAAAVFSGTITHIEHPSIPTADGMYESFATIRVNKIWKGPSDSTIVVAADSLGCYYAFELDKEYLIFAHESNGQLAVNLCNRIRLIETSEQDIALLDAIFSSDPTFQQPPPARVTARGFGYFSMPADQVWVRYFLAEVLPEEPSEAQRQQFVDALMASGLSQAMVASSNFSIYRTGFQFIVEPAQFPNDDMAALLRLLSEAQTNVGYALDIPISKVAVMFVIRDCTLLAAYGQRRALNDARMRAELLVDSLGGRVGAITDMADISERPLITGQEYVQCGSVKMGKWHELPLKADLETAMAITMESTLEVTFAVEKAVSGTQQSPLATPTPRAVLPLPTATPG